jgi:hypothetical protein
MGGQADRRTGGQAERRFIGQKEIVPDLSTFDTHVGRTNLENKKARGSPRAHDVGIDLSVDCDASYRPTACPPVRPTTLPSRIPGAHRRPGSDAVSRMRVLESAESVPG